MEVLTSLSGKPASPLWEGWASVGWGWRGLCMSARRPLGRRREDGWLWEVQRGLEPS